MILAIKLNHEIINGRCTICGEHQELDIGPELFVADTCEQVCWQCGREHTPRAGSDIGVGESIIRLCELYHRIG